jgi:hypothetical protein
MPIASTGLSSTRISIRAGTPSSTTRWRRLAGSAWSVKLASVGVQAP